jgi:putative transcriptional regulator
MDGMADAFRPALLLSMPQLQDPNFSKTVVLLCDYVPEGAFGLVLNRPTEMTASSMVRIEPPLGHANDMPLCIGGPVEPETRVVLTAEAAAGSPLPSIVDGLYLSSSRFCSVTCSKRSATALASSPATPAGASQLDDELAQSPG